MEKEKKTTQVWGMERLEAAKKKSGSRMERKKTKKARKPLRKNSEKLEGLTWTKKGERQVPRTQARLELREEEDCGSVR